jgi:hypothetical protein
VRKPNYHQARKQKELSRKARQQEKLQKRVVAKPEDGSVAVAQEPLAAAIAPTAIPPTGSGN